MTRKVKRGPKARKQQSKPMWKVRRSPRVTKATEKVLAVMQEAIAKAAETPTPRSAEGITRTAGALVSTTREQQHGEKYDNHRRIADIWNGLLSAADKSPLTPLDAHDVANMMEALKIARRYSGQFNLDDYIDGAGYAAVAGEIKGKMEERGAQIDKLFGPDEGTL